MILEALTHHYEDLLHQNAISSFGWGKAKVSYILDISSNGDLLQVICIKELEKVGARNVLVPKVYDNLPAQVKRTLKIAPNFLCDNATYMLGIDPGHKKDRSKESFESCKALHLTLLDKVTSPAAEAVKAFFRNWKPDKARSHFALANCVDDIIRGDNLIFRLKGNDVHKDAEIRASWDRYYRSLSNGPELVCLVTGEKGPVVSVHPKVTGLPGSLSTGTSLISFNAPAFCSYGANQGLNAPIGQYASFACTSALNHLLEDRDKIIQFGDISLLYWSEGNEAPYRDAFYSMFNFNNDSYTDDELLTMLKNISLGLSVEFEHTLLDPNKTFYILGLSSNGGRLVINTFLCNTFRDLISNVQAHYERLNIIKPSYASGKTLTIKQMLFETINPKLAEKVPSRQLSSDILRSVLHNNLYPSTLLSAVMHRIQADYRISWRKAAIIKAIAPKGVDPVLSGGRIRHFHKKLDKGLVQGL